MATRRGLWLGVMKCGCCDTAIADTGDSHCETEKLNLIKRGMQVIYVTPDEWDAKWRDQFLADCPHEAK